MDDKPDRKDAPSTGLTNVVKGGLARAPASAPKVQVVPRQTNESDGDLAAEHHAGPHSLPQAHVDFAPAKAVIVDTEAGEEPRKRRAIATRIIPREALVAATKRSEPKRWPYIVGIVGVLLGMGWFVTRRPLDVNTRNVVEASEKREAQKTSRTLADPSVATAAGTHAGTVSTVSAQRIDPAKSMASSIGSPPAAAVGSTSAQGASKDLKFLEPKK